MSNETEPGHLDHARRKVRFDPTINLGHVLTAVGFLTAGFAAYSDVDKRITSQDVRINAQEKELEAERGRTATAVREMKEDVREMRKGIEKLLERRP